MTCPDCERYKESAKNWRHKAYELSGHPLPWDRGDTWVGLTDEERLRCFDDVDWNKVDWCPDHEQYAKAIEAKLKEKNT